ncbi:MAG: response regulator, partial [Chloroflexota bacterium]
MQNTILLIIDHHPAWLHTVPEHLFKSGFELLAVNTLEAALEITQSNQPSLILLDVSINIPDICHHLKVDKYSQNIPLLLLIPSNNYTSIASALEAGADDYIIKPFPPEEILLRINVLTALFQLKQEQQSLQTAPDTLELAKRNLIEETLKQRNLVLETLNQLSLAISETLETKTILNIVAQLTAEVVEATSTYICNWDSDNGTSTVLAEYIAAESAPEEKISDLDVTYQMDEAFGLEDGWLPKPNEFYAAQIDDLGLDPREKDHMREYGA